MTQQERMSRFLKPHLIRVTRDSAPSWSADYKAVVVSGTARLGAAQTPQSPR